MSTATQAVTAELLGRRFRFQTASGLFSNDRVDDGTRLLLAHLPTTPPLTVLDLGCGYGALGLPVAASYPEATVTLADRDLLAVDTARENARAAKLDRVTCVGSLGYRDLGDGSFDWILCNVPARIGPEAIRYLLGAGRLTERGELRVVVIRDLGPVVERIAAAEQWPIELAGDGARHLIYRVGARPTGSFEAEAIYRRDWVELTCQGRSLRLERPHDISEDPGHLQEGLPLLLECLPKQAPAKALIWRGGYGAAAVALASLDADVHAADRDLLATTFTRRNAAAVSVRVTTHDVLWPHLAAPGPFDLIVCESAAPAGEESGRRELIEAAALLRSGGTLLWLALSRPAKDWLPLLLADRRFTGSVLGSRGRYSVVQIRRRT